ncbi:MAG TPA: ATP-binding protein [Polyangiaceae bacterium]|nr:ATP-binding protein [Polyangiaceae bacterium]
MGEGPPGGAGEAERLRAEAERLRAELDAQRGEVRRAQAISARTMAMFQERALQMELIRQQNEDLDRLAGELSRAKAAEEVRSREFEAVSRLKSDFLANFSHEIRTPLNGILGYCELLMREEGGRLTPHGRRDLSVIKANARTLLALINDILDLSKIEAGRVEVVLEPVDLGAMVDECGATVGEYLRGKAVLLSASVDPAAAALRTDSLKLRQILLNLLSNAAKYTERGEILLEARREGDAAVVTVEDTGEGIAADKLPFIFDKFRRLEPPGRRQPGGTGLGLAIVRELARLLGGSVAVESELGRGTKFTLRLPGAIAEGDAVAVPAPPPSRSALPPPSGRLPRAEAPAPGPRRRVLYVEDSAQNRDVVRRYLRGLYDVLEATDGELGVELAARERPDLILMDLSLPGLDGYEATRRLKADRALGDVPVIALTAHAAREDERRARAAGCAAFLTKPIDRDTLVATIGKHLPGGGS